MVGGYLIKRVDTLYVGKPEMSGRKERKNEQLWEASTNLCLPLGWTLVPTCLRHLAIPALTNGWAGAEH